MAATLPLAIISLAACALASTPAAAQVSFETGVSPWVSSPQWVVVADLNEDGDEDLIVASPEVDAVSVMLGDGSGLFTPSLQYPAGQTSSHVAMGDFDGDGHLDGVVTNFMASSVAILIGDGGGGFLQPPLIHPSGNIPMSLRPGDFNEDGLLDVAVSCHGSSSVALHLGDGLGGLGPPSFVPTSSFPSYVTASDFNEDGHLDLLVSSSQESNFMVFLGDGAGGFPQSDVFPLGVDDAIWFVTLGDLNLDGHVDLVVPCPVMNAIGVFLGDGLGGFESPEGFAAGIYPRSAAVADLDLDGLPDIAAMNSASNEVSVLLGDGTGSFAPPINVPVGPYCISLVSRDLDGDGRIDIAVACQSADSLALLFNRSSYPTTELFRRGDVNGDGELHVDDPVVLLGALFGPVWPELTCADAADVDDSGRIDIADAVRLLMYLFTSSTPPPEPPGPTLCGGDLTPDELPACSFSGCP
ncbi:MAG: FG-GAP-like repeat-containing protein [Planctomycetota bacterium]